MSGALDRPRVRRIAPVEEKADGSDVARLEVPPATSRLLSRRGVQRHPIDGRTLHQAEATRLIRARDYFREGLCRRCSSLTYVTAAGPRPLAAFFSCVERSAEMAFRIMLNLRTDRFEVRPLPW